MFGFFVLSAEEVEIVVEDGINEAQYRPFPGGRNARLEELRELEDVYGVDDLQAQSLRRRLSSRFRLERMVAGRYWPKDSRGTLLLVSRVDDRTSAIEESFNAVGIAYARTGARSHPGTRKLYIGPWRRIDQIPVSALLTELSESERQEVWSAILGPARPVSAVTRERIISSLQRSVSDYSQIASLLEEEGRVDRRSRRQRDLIRRDANATALRIFGRRWRSAEPVIDPTPTQFAERVIEAIESATENDYITDDAAVFPGWERAPRSERGWWEFRNRGRRLLVKNVNVSPVENQTGADLIYVRRDPDSVVLVQYKILERVGRTRDLVYRPDGRLDDQINRMMSYEALGDPGEGATQASEYRLGTGFTFVKFLAEEGREGLADDELTEGYYLPSAMTRWILQNPDVGPRGGVVYYVTRQRYINSSTFASLVQDGWLGSTGNATTILERLAGLRPVADATIAVDEPTS